MSECPVNENKVVYNKDGKISSWCKIEGIYLHLKTPAQKLIWMNHVTERDKVFIEDNVLIGVGMDTEKVIAYIKGDEYDKAFVAAAIWQHACEDFKNRVVGEQVSPDEDYAVIWLTNESLLIGDNDLYSPIVSPCGAHAAARQLGVYIPSSYQAAYRDSLAEAKKRYLAYDVQQWVDDPFKDAMSNWYLWGAFHHADMAVESIPDTPPLQDAEWYSAYQIAIRLSSQYCDYNKELYHELANRINAGNLVEKLRESLNK